jgi:hypothetical protein
MIGDRGPARRAGRDTGSGGGRPWSCVLAAAVLACAAASPASAQAAGPAAPETQAPEIPAFAAPAFATEATGSGAPEQPSAAQPAKQGLTVAILDLATAPDLLPAPAAAVRPAWRTSFGSERQTAPAPKPTARDELLATLDGVDAVLIQGIASPRALRRLFPPRQWRLVVSRRAAAKTTATTGEPIAMTAIAVKARSDLRVTARSFALRHVAMPAPAVTEVKVEADVAESVEASDEIDADLATPVSGTIDDVVAASVSAANVSMNLAAGPSPSETAAAHPATAVRLLARERAVWLAAIAMPRACAAEDPPCPALRDLDLWREGKRSAGEPTLIGSLMNSDASADKSTAGCAAYAVESDLRWHYLAAGAGGVSPETGKGCVVILRTDD